MRSFRDRMEITEVAILKYLDVEAASDTVLDSVAGEALARFQETFRVRNEKVVISIPGSETFIRSLSLVLVGKKSVHDLVQYEAQEEIPFVLDEVIWDYDMFEPADPKAREREGLIFAVKKNLLNNFFLSLSSANLPVDDLQTAPIALYNFFKFDQDISRGCLVVDVGSEGTNLVAMTPTEYWIRSVPIGGGKASELLAKEFGMDARRAEAAKLNLARSKHAKEILEVLMPAAMELVGEVQKSLAYQRGQNKDYPFERVCLVGGGAWLMGLKTMLARSLNLEVVNIEQFGRITVSEEANVEPLQEDLGSFAVATGLALQGCGKAACDVSLIPQKTARRTMLGRTKPYFVAIPAAILVTLLAAYGFVKQRNMALRALFDNVVNQEISKVKGLQDKLEKARDVSSLRRDMQELVRLGRGRHVWLDVLDELMKILPDNSRAEVAEKEKVWLIDLNVRWPRPDRDPGKSKSAAQQGRPRLKGELTAGIRMGRVETEALSRVGRLVERKLRNSQRFVTESIRIVGGGPRKQLRAGAERSAPGQSGYYICTLEFEFYVTP